MEPLRHQVSKLEIQAFARVVAALGGGDEHPLKLSFTPRGLLHAEDFLRYWGASRI
jgi:hypothetical protein